MKQPQQTFYLTRAEYEAFFGTKTDPSSVAARCYSPDGETVEAEFVFTDAREVLELERLWRLS